MSFTANKTGRDVLVAIAENDLPAIVTALSTEYGTTLPAIREVYRHSTLGKRPDQMHFPNIEIQSPDGELLTDGRDNITSTLSFWIVVNVSTGTIRQADELCEGYLSALVRAYGYAQGRVTAGPYMVETVELSTSPPLSLGTETDSKQLQSVGIRVVVTMAEEV